MNPATSASAAGDLNRAGCALRPDARAFGLRVRRSRVGRAACRAATPPSGAGEGSAPGVRVHNALLEFERSPSRRRRRRPAARLKLASRRSYCPFPPLPSSPASPARQRQRRQGRARWPPHPSASGGQSPDPPPPVPDPSSLSPGWPSPCCQRRILGYGRRFVPW